MFLAWHIVNIFSIHDSPSISGLIVFTNTSYANWEKDLKNFTTSHFISKKRNCHETEDIYNSPSANKVKKKTEFTTYLHLAIWSPVSNIESNDSQNIGLEVYKDILLESFQILALPL